MWLIILAVLVVCLLIRDYLVKIRRNRKLAELGIKGPRFTVPLIGDSWLAIGNDRKNVFGLLRFLREKYGSSFRVWLLDEVMVVTRNVKIFEAVLSSQKIIKKSYMYDMLSGWLGDGLLLSDGAKWHARRKILTPTYHFKILEQFVEVFDQQSRVLVQKLYTKADGKTALDIFPLVCLTALDIIAESAMGVEINAQEYPDFPYAKAVKDATNVIATRFMKPVQQFQIGFLLTAFPSYLKLRKSVKILHDFTDKVIEDRKSKLNNNYNTIKSDEAAFPMGENSESYGAKKRLAFLDVLLQSTIDGKLLSHKEIREEVDTFMFEGHDTTTSGISHCLYLLSRHSDVQQRVYEEIIEVLGIDGDKPITMRDLQDLKYLEAVIKETLRLYPAVPMIGRYTTEDLEIDGKIFPAHCSIILLIYDAARDPEIFSNPLDFKPERFYEDSSIKSNPFAYVPFSAGPRNCIGQKFAMLEIKSTVSMLLRHFELLPLGPDVVSTMNLTLRSETGVHLGLRPRKK